MPSNSNYLTYPGLTNEVSIEEVQQAIRKLHRGKACGPDRIPNDFYLDHADEMEPVLALLFNRVMDSCTVLALFAKAHVYCIPKIARPATGLDCRPIALLNSDYKILTRLLATRLSMHMESMIHEAQNGFVPGRVIQDTIDVFSAIQRLVNAGMVSEDAIALFLDFTKAYDSLDRCFLKGALEWHQLPSEFICLVMALHDSTVAAFLANGCESDDVDMDNGIRQGCHYSLLSLWIC